MPLKNRYVKKHNPKGRNILGLGKFYLNCLLPWISHDRSMDESIYLIIYEGKEALETPFKG